MIKNIVFDLGGVLIDWDPRRVYRTIFHSEKEIDRFFNNICTYEWNMEQDAGRLIADATQEKIAEFPAWKNEIEAYYGRWEEMLVGPINETVDALKQIIDSKKFRVLALTNWSAETFPIALKKYDFLHWFEGIVVSGTEKCRKPYPEIYNILFERYNLDPSASIFIDDSKANVEASKSLGMEAIQFNNAQQCKVDLERYIDFSFS